MRAAFLVVGCLCAWAWPAGALEQVCKQEDGYCLQQPERRVVFRLNESCDVGGSLERCIDMVKSALQVWNTPECSDMKLVYDGTTPRTDIGYDADHPDQNMNLILVQGENWSHEPSSRRVTTIAYDSSNGNIVDFDIEVNNVNHDIDEVTLHNLLAREFGAALGFEDSDDATSVMYGFYELEDEERNLSEDDIESLCLLYPAPGAPPLPSSGCGCTFGGDSPDFSLLLCLLALAILIRIHDRVS